ncbi:MAG: hypothetical protein EBX15_08010, partial [Acidimicrobiia bacterium]|nr:hypothetical protein [Acidimicrobiia bacterium]
MSVWDRVLGQESAVATLRALAERPTHAYLFVGPEGAGKETAARSFAAHLVTGSDNSTSRAADLRDAAAIIGGHRDRADPRDSRSAGRRGSPR